MAIFHFTSCPAGYAVAHDELGPIGTVHRIVRTAKSGAQRAEWQPVTPEGTPGPVIDGRHYAARWLLYEAAPELLRPVPVVDPILEALRGHVGAGNVETATAVFLAALGDDIEQMRSDRAGRNPPALWAHLDRYVRWLAVINAPGEPLPVPQSLPPRLAHLHAV